MAAVLAFGATATSCNPLGTAHESGPSGGVIAASPPSGLTEGGEAGSTSTSSSTTSASSAAASLATSGADQTTSASAPVKLDPAAKPVAHGELVAFRVLRGTSVLIDARSSGLAHYDTSPSCEVPGQPCYDAPSLDKVARIDVGAPPEVPGTQTTFITGHSNRYRPDDPAKGVFSHLQDVRAGDQLVLTTTMGVFYYRVTKAFAVPFDQLTTNPDVVTVRKDTVVAISCVISADQRSYVGNYVVVAGLAGSNPI